MNNKKFAELLYMCADVMELRKIQWKPRAYRKAARAIENLDQDIADIYKENGKKGLDAIPGVGKGIADHIVEFLKKGKVQKFQKLLKDLPKGYAELMKIEGLGPKKLKRLTKLGIKNVSDLKKAVKHKKLRRLGDFGETTEKNILRSIKIYRARKGRMLLGEALPLAQKLIEELKKKAPIQEIDYAGSLKRMKETIGDIDILVISKKPKEVVDAFTKLPDVARVLAKGQTKGSVVLKQGVQVDLRAIQPESYSAALQYFIGNKDHNIAVRNIAIKKGYKLSEYGLFSKKTGKPISCKSEADIYKKLGLAYPPPELREGDFLKKIPSLVKRSDIKGDLQMHSTYSDGTDTIKHMAMTAKKLGYAYIAITDHSASEKIASGMDIDTIKKQWKEIARLRLKGIKVLRGAEVNILKDGSLDYPDEVLKKLQVVVAAVHTGFKSKNITERIIHALENRYVDILAHPTGRLINKREPYKVNLKKVFDVAAHNNKIMEINCQPARLDLSDTNAKLAKEYGLKFSINTDSHSAAQLTNMQYGVAQARRAGLSKSDIVNALPLLALKRLLKRI